MSIARKASFVLSILGFAGFCFGASLDFTLGQRGLVSLTYGGVQMITNQTYGTLGYLTSLTFKQAGGSTVNESWSPPAWVLDTAANTVIITRPGSKAKLMCKYVKAADTTLEFRIVIQNLSNDTLSYIDMPLITIGPSDAAKLLNAPCGGSQMECQEGSRNVSDFAQFPVSTEPTSPYERGPGVSMFGFGNSFCATLCNMNDFKKLIYYKIGAVSSSPKISVMGGRQAASPPGCNPAWGFNASLSPVVVDDNFRVKPNSLSDTLVYQLRFTSGEFSYPKLAASAQDIFMRYGGEYPFKWTESRADRRPIMHANLGDLWNNLPLVPGFGGIPYINDATALKEFHDRALARAETWISKMRKGKMRGVIAWGFEGFDGLKAPLSLGNLLYFGDPDKVDSISPEWGYKYKPGAMCVADTFFLMIKNAGFEPGLYVQPMSLTRVGNNWIQANTCSTADGFFEEEEFVKDIGYCYNRWNMRLFYMDDNLYHGINYDNQRRGGFIQSAERVGKRIMDAYPSVTFCQEWPSVNWFRWGSDYSDRPAFAFINYIWPDAYSTLIPNWDGALHRPEPMPVSYISGIKNHGDVMFPGEYPGFGQGGDLDTLDKILRIVGNTWSRPTATITGPRAGSELSTNFKITATAAADSGFTLSRVEFLSAGILLGADSTAPYEFQWTKALPGKHSLYARAVNNINKKACSPPVCITVNPSVSINRDLQFINPALKNNSGPMSVSIYSLNGRLVRKIDFKDPAHFVAARAIKGLSSGIYVLKAKHANGTIVKRKIEAIW